MLKSFWVSTSVEIDLEAIVDLPAMFPMRKNVRRIQPLDLPYACIGLEGEGTFAQERTLPEQASSHQSVRGWRIWVLQKKSVCLVAVQFMTDDGDPELKSLVRMVLNTLEFAEEPAEPPQLFAERALQLARDRFPLVECELAGDFQLRLGESQINLFNFYRAYVNAPAQFEEILLPALTTVVRVQEWGPAQTEPNFNTVRDRIMPMLYPEPTWRETFPNFTAVPWIADLVILYVVDESQAYWYIREDLLQTWNLSAQELHDLAMRNLDAYFEDHPMELTLAGDENGTRLLMPTRPDAYNTVRLLSEAFHDHLRETLGTELAVGIPNRDFFVAVSLEDEATIEQIRHKVAHDFERMDHPLSSRLLLVGPDGVSEFCPS